MAVNGLTQLHNATAVEQLKKVEHNADSQNSVFENINTSEEKQNTSNIDKLVEKLCAEFSKLGLTPEQLKQANIIAKVSGMNEAQIENASEQDLNRIFECIKTAIKDATINGKVDLEKATRLANDYHTALVGGWDSIDSFKNANKKNNEDISARMERFFGLKKGSFATLPQEKIEEYLERYFKDFFLAEVKKSKNPEKTYKKQLQDFTKLLTNTPDEQKAVFRQAIVSLQASNRLKGLEAVLASFDSQKARTEWADGCDTEFTKKFATKADCEGNVPNQSEVTAAVAKLTEQKSEEGIRNHQEALQKEAVEFFEKNKDALARIKEKETKREQLTEEEKQLVLLRDNYFTAAKAGEITGTALNQIIDATVKDNLLDKMNRDAYELPIYKEVMTQVTEFVENNPDTLALTKEELTKLLDKVTNGNYSEVVKNGDDANIKAPAIKHENKADAASDSGIGLNNNTLLNVEQKIQAIAEKKQKLNNDDKKAPEFVVDKQTPKKSEVKTVAEAKQLAGSFTKVIENFKQYGDQVMEDAAITVARFGRSTQVYYANLCSNMKFTNAIEKNNNGWTLEQIQHLNLSFTQRKEMTEKAVEKRVNKAEA